MRVLRGLLLHRTRSPSARRLLQAARNSVARRLPRQLPDRHLRGAVQEHAPRLLPERQRPAAQTGRHRGGRSLARARHRHRLAHGRSGRQTDAPHGIQPFQRRIQEDLPQGQTLRHRTLAGGHRPRTGDDDPRPPDRRGDGPQHEDRRRGVSGRQDQGDLLLHRRRTGRFPRADQGLRRAVPHPHRDEADRRPSGGRPHRRIGRLRPRAVLRLVDFEFHERYHGRGTHAGPLAQPPETRRTVLEAEVLSDVRIRRLRRRTQGVPAPARTVADARRRVFRRQERHSVRYDDLQHQQGFALQRRHAAHRAREGDHRPEPCRQKT